MKKKLINALFIFVGCYLVGVIASYFMENPVGIFEFEKLFGMFGAAGAGMGILLGLLYVLTAKDKKGKTELRTGKTTSGDKMEQYYESHFLTEEELKTDKFLLYNTWETLKNMGKTKGNWVIRNSMVNNKLVINMLDNDCHCLIIGTSGSGKTSMVIDPEIRILAETPEKPTLIISDPKTELYTRHGAVLKDKGYDIKVLDLRNPSTSLRWNPMEGAYVMYHRSKNLKKEVKVYENADPRATKLKIIEDVQYEKTWYEFGGVAYPNRAMLENDLESKRKIFIDEAKNELREIAATFCTVESSQDRSWETGVQDFVYGLMLAMLEDSDNPKLGMTKERFNLYNLNKIATYRDSDPDNMFGTLRDYCSVGRDKLSEVRALTSAVVNNAPNTARSYAGVLQGKIGFLQDMGICYLTSASDINFETLTDRPTAFFIISPDEKESRHGLVTLCISQLYKKLIAVASERPGLMLPRTAYCLLDEFANLPKFPKMDSLITVGRSRRIFFGLVIQSYAQLINRYGKEVSEIIIGNCQIQIFLGTDDQATKESFSKLCGDISIEKKEESTSKTEGGKGGDGGKNVSTSEKLVQRPLIYPYELGQLDFGTGVVKIFKKHPIKVKYAQFHKIPFFEQKNTMDSYRPAKALNEQEMYYDIKKRNSQVGGGFGDFDDLY